MKVSVCIATYNGEKYLLEQFISITKQLQPDDEIIIVDDCSTDGTVNLIDQLSDSRIKIYKNDTNKGHVFSFGRAISLASNEIVFMADQDDVWLPGRLELMKTKLLLTGCLMVSANSDFMDTKGNLIHFHQDGVHAADSNNYLKNILAIFAGKTNYYGCTMAFNKKLNNVLLPIPGYVESHDLWIAMAGNILKSNLHLEDKTLVRRIHGNNASVIKRKLSKKLISRIVFAISFFHLLLRSKITSPFNSK